MAAESRYGSAPWVAGGLLLLAGMAWWTLQPPEIPVSGRDWPDPAHLDSLQRYLAPVEEVAWMAGPSAETVQWTDPYAEPGTWTGPTEGERRDSRASSAPDRQWRVEAILITDQGSTAVINDIRVREGDVLPDGARVARIERDRVALLDPGGSRRILWLGTTEGLE